MRFKKLNKGWTGLLLAALFIISPLVSPMVSITVLPPAPPMTGMTFSPQIAPVGVYAAQRYVQVSGLDDLTALIADAVEAHEPEVHVVIYDYSEADYTADWCELFPLEEIYMHGTQRGRTAEITFELTYTQAERILYSLQGGRIALNERERLAANEAREIFEEIIHDGMTDYEKQLAIHDYLVLNVAYDNSDTPSADAYTPYGALINRRAVCQGYTETARILLSLSNIWNGTLTGTADREDHIWNVVGIGGELYHMDITWDAGLVFEDGSHALSHAYFNLTDEQLRKDHRWDEDLQTAKFGEGCTADEYNYFKLNGLIAKSNSEYKNLITEKYLDGEREIEVMFDGIPPESVNIRDAAAAAGSSGYTGFPIPSQNALWVRFK